MRLRGGHCLAAPALSEGGGEMMNRSGHFPSISEKVALRRLFGYAQFHLPSTHNVGEIRFDLGFLVWGRLSSLPISQTN
jgi:hypothetical protein